MFVLLSPAKRLVEPPAAADIAFTQPDLLDQSQELVEVVYVFGPRLPAAGRCIVTEGDMDRIRRRSGQFTAYDVEVCRACKWNHLLRTNPVV